MTLLMSLSWSARAGGDGDQRHLGVEQRDGAVLQLAGRIALGVDVADLLELEGALERDRVADAPADEHEAARVDVAPGQPRGGSRRSVERPLGLVGQRPERRPPAAASSAGVEPAASLGDGGRQDAPAW